MSAAVGTQPLDASHPLETGWLVYSVEAASHTFTVGANSAPAMQRSEEVPVAVAVILPVAADNTASAHYSS